MGKVSGSRMEGLSGPHQKIAIILALVGVVGFVLSSIVRAGPVGDLIFECATVCLGLAVIIFIGYIITGLCKDFERIK
jgi:hypothetical protein